MAKSGGGGGSRGGGAGGNFGYLATDRDPRLPDRVFRDERGRLMGQYGSIREQVPTREQDRRLREINRESKRNDRDSRARVNENLAIRDRVTSSSPVQRGELRKGQYFATNDGKVFKVVSDPVRGIPTVRSVGIQGRPYGRNVQIPDRRFKLTTNNMPGSQIFALSPSDARTLLTNTRAMTNNQNRNFRLYTESRTMPRAYAYD